MSQSLADFPSAVIDRYEIGPEVGRGAMSVVYRARDVAHDREVAIKVLRPEFGASVATDRFLLEIEINGRLEHPNIVPLLDAGRAADLLFLVMPLIQGHSLRELLQREGQLDVDDAIGIATEVAGALSHAHERGIVHRDIKPSNILLPDGRAMVVDFGVAKAVGEATDAGLTLSGHAVGTPAYMSPEQAGGRVDPRSDLYSLACVLYEMLVGDPPFSGRTAQVLLARHAAEDVPSLRTVRVLVPVAVERTIMRALAKTPADRFRSTRAFASALTAAATQTDIEMSVGATGAPRSVAATIAVLPFVNLSPDPSREYFSDGMAEELIAALTKVEGLRVASRTSSFAFKGTTADVHTIGEGLNVDLLLEGSVRWGDTTLRVTAKLTSVSTGFGLWAETYERPVEDIFSVQEEISRAIVGNLPLRLPSEGSGTLVRRYTDNVKAYHLYLRGRFFWNKRSPQGAQSAKLYYEAALKEDPNYALAYAGLADTFITLSQFQYAPPREVLPRAEAAVRKALEIDNDIAEAQTTLAHIYEIYHWDWDNAVLRYERALGLNPYHADGHTWYGDFLHALGRVEEGASHIARARELEPLSVPTGFQAARMRFRAREYDAAIAEFREVLEMDPHYVAAHLYLGLTFVQTGQFSEAFEQLQKAIELVGEQPILFMALAYAHGEAGQRPQALAFVKRMDEIAKERYVPSAFFAVAYAGLKDLDHAFERLERAHAERSVLMVWLAVEPYLDRLRGDPRFDAFLKRMRLPSFAPAVVPGQTSSGLHGDDTSRSTEPPDPRST